MDIYLKGGNKEIRLPVLPDGFQIQTKQNNQVVNVTSLGELNLKGNRGLKSISLSSFFPLHEGRHGYERHGRHTEAYSLVNIIESWKDSKEVIRLLITQSNINGEFLIDDFSYGVSDGSGDIDYSISFSEYVRPKILIKNGKKSSLYENTRSIKKTPKTYTVKKGDTLKRVAKKQLGSSKKFITLASLNHIASPYKIKAGQVLLLSEG